MQQLTKRGVRIEFVKECLTFTGEDSPMANLLLSVMGAFAEFERALIRERQREGIALAKQRGAYRGRKKALSPEQIVELQQRASLLALPEIQDDLIRHYTFNESDLALIRQRRGDANRLGFAVQLCLLRYPGYALAINMTVAEPVPIKPKPIRTLGWVIAIRFIRFPVSGTNSVRSCHADRQRHGASRLCLGIAPAT